MGRRKTVLPIGKLQRMRNLELAERDAAPVLNPHTANHGDYRIEGNHGRLKAIRNIAGSTVERWKRDKLLDDRQMTAINHCIGLWHQAGGMSGLVMDLNKLIGSAGQGYLQAEALAELAGYKMKLPREYWNVFENCCRFDEPGGVAGSRFANDNGRASQSALMCVRFVADLFCMWRGF